MQQKQGTRLVSINDGKQINLYEYTREQIR